jgi:hypothetical protein
MEAATMAKLERLAAARIELIPIPGLERYFVFARDGFASLVERRGAGFGRVGAAGRVTERGFAALVWRDDEAFFVAKQFEERAGAEDVERLRRFSEDLEAALG